MLKERLMRRCGCLDGRIKLQHRIQRFAQFLSQSGGRPAHGVEHFFLLPRLLLLLRQRISGRAVHRLQSNHVIPSQTRNRARDIGFASDSLAKVARYSGRKPRIRRLIHQAKRLPHALLGDDAEERRLFKLHVQTLPERVVKNLIASRVAEIAKNDRVGCTQRLHLLSAGQPHGNGQAEDEYCNGLHGG